MTITEPGTIEDLVADAAGRGDTVTARMIRDWTAAGLLDSPQRRSAGKGHGSRPALYPATQRELFLTLLHHRPGNGIKNLARIPVCIWMYWGEEYVPLRQVRVAIKTWLGNPRVSLRQAVETARQVLGQLDNPAATDTARRELVNTLTAIANTARLDAERLDRAIRQVFEPDYGPLRRAVGHPAAPLTADAMVDLIKARVTAANLLLRGEVTDEEFLDARHAHLISYADYAMQQRTLAAETPPGNPNFYEPVDFETAANQCCGNLLTMIGLRRMYPEQATRIKRLPAPRISFTAP
jgi:hypothetical protein